MDNYTDQDCTVILTASDGSTYPCCRYLLTLACPRIDQLIDRRFDPASLELVLKFICDRARGSTDYRSRLTPLNIVGIVELSAEVGLSDLVGVCDRYLASNLAECVAKGKVDALGLVRRFGLSKTGEVMYDYYSRNIDKLPNEFMVSATIDEIDRITRTYAKMLKLVTVWLKVDRSVRLSQLEQYLRTNSKSLSEGLVNKPKDRDAILSLINMCSDSAIREIYGSIFRSM